MFLMVGLPGNYLPDAELSGNPATGRGPDPGSLHPEQLRFGTGGPSVPELTMDVATLEDELAGLVFDVAHERERQVFKGRYHRGRGHVVQIVGRNPADG